MSQCLIWVLDRRDFQTVLASKFIQSCLAAVAMLLEEKLEAGWRCFLINPMHRTASVPGQP